jgi:hypothetical protein
MRRITFVSLAAVMALSACSDGGADKDGDGKITGEEAAVEAREAILPEPGLYRATVEIEEMTVPGMPAGMADQMKQSMAAQMSIENCLTEADRANMVKEMVPDSGDSCTYDKYEMSGGKIDAKLTCKAPDGGTVVTTMNGTFTSTGVDMVLENTQSGGRQENGTHMKMRMKNTRIGECAGNEG